MCELFAMSCKTPAILGYSLHEFASHGGLSSHNTDGWGVAIYQNREAFVLKEPSPAADSPLAHLIERKKLPARLALAHIRRASTGLPCLENTHPFCRVVAGQCLYFAHNGNLNAFVDQDRGDLLKEMVGSTDSEHVFLSLIKRITHRGQLLSLDSRLARIADFADELRPFGTANFLYTDGEVIVGHAHRRHGNRQEVNAPGLWLWQANEADMPFEWRVRGAHIETVGSATTLLASVPLDNRNWIPLPFGSVIALQNGEEIARFEASDSTLSIR